MSKCKGCGEEEANFHTINCPESTLTEKQKDVIKIAFTKIRKDLHHIKVTLKDGKVIEGELFQVDVIEKWLDFTESKHPILFEDCASIVNEMGQDLLNHWSPKN